MIVFHNPNFDVYVAHSIGKDKYAFGSTREEAARKFELAPREPVNKSFDLMVIARDLLSTGGVRDETRLSIFDSLAHYLLRD